uniref:Uncharacterized protein n=1 Tax=Anguilla anguilla TaxID=7936 RepID=A0A0E9WZN9_ANGAN
MWLKNMKKQTGQTFLATSGKFHNCSPFGDNGFHCGSFDFITLFRLIYFNNFFIVCSGISFDRSIVDL